VELVRSVYADAWRANWGAVRSTDAEFEQLAKDLRMIVDPRIVYLAFVDGELAGLSLSIPDANQAIKHANGRLLPLGIAKILWHKRKITHIRVLALGVLDKYRNHGIDTALYHETFDKGRAMGYRSAEMSWILEDNYAMRNPLEKFGAHVYKTYRVYEKPL
jgi:GNAT superfamily N-acetyltransferase